MALDPSQVSPIGRIPGGGAPSDVPPGTIDPSTLPPSFYPQVPAQGDPNATSPVGAPPTSLPTLNPNNSPYSPLNLPDISPRQYSGALPQEEPVQNLGAVSHAGAVAYLADKVLRGAVQGIDAAHAYQAAQTNKKLAAQQSIYNDQASQLYKMAQAGIDPNSQEYKDAYNRTLTSWQAMMQSIGEKIPQQQGGTSKKSKAGSGMDPLQAVYQGAISTGPPVFHQVQPFLTPEYRAKVGVASATQGAQGQAGLVQAQAGVTAAQSEAQLESIKQERNQLLAKPNRTPEDEERINQLTQALVSPMQRLTAAQSTRYYTDPETGAQWQYQVNAAGQKVEGTDRPVAGSAGKAPPVIKYDNTTGTVSDPHTGKVYFPNQLDLPLNVASMFKAADNQLFKKQQLALQKIYASGEARTQSYLNSRVVQVVDPQNPNQTIYMKAIDAINQGVPGTSSVWYKLQMPTGQERARADLATSAREQLNTMAGILRSRSDLFGPTSGRTTDFTKWVGSQDPDAQRFAAAAKIASDHLAGVFGGRSKEALQGIYDAIGQNKTNPAAAMAALEQMNIAAAQIQSRGQGAIAGTGQPTGQPGAAGTAPAAAPTTTSPAATPTTVLMRAPNGQTKQVPLTDVDHYKELGATVVQ